MTAASHQSPLTPERVAEIRRFVFASGAVTEAGLDLLFATLAVHGDDGPPDWPVLFREAVATWLVEQTPPAGVVSEANADWLLARIGEDGRVFRQTEFEALVHVMDQARFVPDRLVAFALRTLTAAIVEGSGPLVDSSPRIPGAVAAADVEALRRVLYAASSEGFGTVTRAEADALFDLVRATQGRANAPAFDDLFARAIGNHVLARRGRATPDVAEALRRERWLDERQPLLGGLRGVFSRALTCVISGDGFVDAAGGWLAKGAADAVLGPADSEMIEAQEAAWLKGQIATCDRATPAIRSLERFLSYEPGAEALAPMFDKVA